MHTLFFFRESRFDVSMHLSLRTRTTQCCYNSGLSTLILFFSGSSVGQHLLVGYRMTGRKVGSGRRTEPKLLCIIMYSLSPNDLLKEVFVMTKHLELKCEVVVERNRSC